MLEFLPKDIRDGLEAARMRDLKKKSRLRLHLGDQVYPILRFWDDGFSVDAKLAPQMRGLVDIYDGARHVFQCLVIASTPDAGELVCDFKRVTAVSEKPPLDFWLDEDAPVALLSKA